MANRHSHRGRSNATSNYADKERSVLSWTTLKFDDSNFDKKE